VVPLPTTYTITTESTVTSLFVNVNLLRLRDSNVRVQERTAHAECMVQILKQQNIIQTTFECNSNHFSAPNRIIMIFIVNKFHRSKIMFTRVYNYLIVEI